MDDLNGTGSCQHAMIEDKATTKIFDEIESDDLILTYEPVSVLDIKSSAPLKEAAYAAAYSVCLPGLFEPDGTTRKTGNFIRDLEEQGLACEFDRLILSKIVRKLEAGVCTSVGCTASVKTLLPDIWWANFLEQLDSRPEIVSRLVIEIADTAPIVDFASTISLLNSLKQVGCRIAIDNFGVGHSSCRAMMAINADIIKIDQSFLWRAGGRIGDRDAFGHLVGLARSMATSVVVKGIETEDHLDMSMAAGATHGQGGFIGRPSLSPAFDAYAAARSQLTSSRLTRAPWQDRMQKQSVGSRVHPHQPGIANTGSDCIRR